MRRGGFSLFEMMMVMVIISAIYAIIITKVPTKSKDSSFWLSIDDRLRAIEYHEYIALRCTKDTKCEIIVDNKLHSKTEYIASDDIEVYTIDADFRANRVYYKDTLLLEYKIDKRGGSQELIVATEDRVSHLGGFIKPAREYTNIEKYIDNKKEIINQAYGDMR
jgi:prepilin-type N-terminal cleavage/methylation domain-containing protein